MEDPKEQRDPSSKPEEASLRPPIQPWKKVLLIVAIAITVAGGVLQAVAWSRGDAAPVSDSRPGIVNTLAPGLADAVADEPDALDRWAPTVFRLGFGFFAGFCIAYALRAFLKVFLITMGIALLLLLGLQYAGLINVDWSGIEHRYDQAVPWLKEQVSDFGRFVTGYIPSAASGLAGFAVGIKKN